MLSFEPPTVGNNYLLEGKMSTKIAQSLLIRILTPRGYSTFLTWWIMLIFAGLGFQFAGDIYAAFIGDILSQLQTASTVPVPTIPKQP